MERNSVNRQYNEGPLYWIVEILVYRNIKLLNNWNNVKILQKTLKQGRAGLPDKNRRADRGIFSGLLERRVARSCKQAFVA